MKQEPQYQNMKTQKAKNTSLVENIQKTRRWHANGEEQKSH